MGTLNKEKFFFFYKDCSDLEIYPNSLEHAYLAILNDDLFKAHNIFTRLDSPRSRWGNVLVSILSDGWMTQRPTYFQIRNFLEIDIDFLLKNQKIDYVEQILGALEIFSKINSQTYKFAARVMLENHLLQAAYTYMEQAKQVYYHDPELHFMLAKYYIKVKNYEKAYFSIKECLSLLPDYYPAINLKHEIEEIVV
jgi:tetratricopeptide (TPR) repeat protein